MNKKGQTEDLADLFLTLFGAIIFYLFFAFALFSGVAKTVELSITNVQYVKQTDAAINNLRVQTQEGVNLEGENIDDKIARSRVLGGVTITDCPDYPVGSDCELDTVGVAREAGHSCEWTSENKCSIKKTVKYM